MKIDFTDQDIENFLFFVDVALKQLGVAEAERAASLVLRLKAAKMEEAQAEPKQFNAKEGTVKKVARKKTTKKVVDSESDESRTTQP